MKFVIQSVTKWPIFPLLTSTISGSTSPLMVGYPRHSTFSAPNGCSCPRCNDGAGVENSGTCLEFRLDFLIHGKISFFAAGHGEMSSLQHLSFSGCCGNATRKGEQRAARNPPFRYKNSGTRHFWRAPLGLIRILHPNHITGSIRCHLNPYQSVAGRCCSLISVLLRCWPFLFIARHYTPCETICIDF